MKMNFIKRPMVTVMAGALAFGGVQAVAAPTAGAAEQYVDDTKKQARFGAEWLLNDIDKYVKLKIEKKGDSTNGDKVSVELIVNSYGSYWWWGNIVRLGVPEGVTIDGKIRRYYGSENNWTLDHEGDFMPGEGRFGKFDWHRPGTSDFKDDLTITYNNNIAGAGTQDDGPHNRMRRAFGTTPPLQGFLVDWHRANNRTLRYTFDAKLDASANADDLWWIAQTKSDGFVPTSYLYTVVQGPFNKAPKGPAVTLTHNPAKPKQSQESKSTSGRRVLKLNETAEADPATNEPVVNNGTAKNEPSSNGAPNSDNETQAPQSTTPNNEATETENEGANQSGSLSKIFGKNVKGFSSKSLLWLIPIGLLAAIMPFVPQLQKLLGGHMR